MSTDFVAVYADRDILYGALYVKDCGDYAEVVEVTDLDSAAGTTDMVNVSTGSVGLYGRNLADNRRRLTEAFASVGGFTTTSTREWRRLQAWAALWQYGSRDVDTDVVIATSRDASGGRDDWRPTQESYGVDGQIARWQLRVNGEKGLRRWLARYADVDTTAQASA